MAAPSGSTARLALPYPIPDDNVDVPRDVQALAARLDPLAAIDSQGTLTARPIPGVAGRYYYATDTGVVYRDDGTAWNAVSLVDNAVTTTKLANGAVTLTKLDSTARSVGQNNGPISGPTFSDSTTNLGRITMTCRGGPVLLGAYGYFLNAGVNGTRYNTQNGFLMDGGYLAPAGIADDSRNGYYLSANATFLVAAPSPVAHTFDHKCMTGAASTWALYAWGFWAVELI